MLFVAGAVVNSITPTKRVYPFEVSLIFLTVYSLLNISIPLTVTIVFAILVSIGHFNTNSVVPALPVNVSAGLTLRSVNTVLPDSLSNFINI